MAKRRKLHEVSIHDDIRYRGPLSWQSFQILGWLCISVMAVILVLKLGIKLAPSAQEKYTPALDALSYFSSLSLPFLLIANFSRILNNSDGYRLQLLRNGGAFIGIFLASALIFYRYVIGTVQAFSPEPDIVPFEMAEMFRQGTRQGFLAFNIFSDLLLCTLFMFFLNSRPKRFFTGKKLLLFRLLALVPVGLEVFSIIMKGRAASGYITLPVWSFALLTVKPPMAFAVFVFLALHIKARERRFCRHGRTHEEYLQFLGTNRNSFHFSLYLIVVIIIAVVLDFFILAFLTAASAGSVEAFEASEDVMEFAKTALAMGFGNAFPLLLVTPALLLYSYTRAPKNKKLSMFIPMVGICLMLVIFIEGLHEVLLDVSKSFDPAAFTESLESFGSYVTTVK